MKKHLFAVAAVAAALSAPAALAAGDPAAALKADLASVLATAQIQHDTVVAAANRLVADARSGNRQALRGDIAALQSAFAGAQGALAANRQTIAADIAALKGTKPRKGGVELGGVLQQAQATLGSQKSSLDAALAAARQAFAQAANSAAAARPAPPARR